ncbi:MAG: hypothetical protein FJ284_10585 [Planctomycetes bacterium]|nr:hypothetical protein [Planctomycetota bacterium]
MRWEGRRQSQNVEDRRRVGREVAVAGGLITLLIMVAAIFSPNLVPALKLFEGQAEASVRLEPQADFLAGVWAHYLARDAGVLDQEDVREAINAAAANGDDRIQEQIQGYFVDDAFTHGFSEQRVRWFMYGLREGDPKLMDRVFEVDPP